MADWLNDIEQALADPDTHFPPIRMADGSFGTPIRRWLRWCVDEIRLLRPARDDAYTEGWEQGYHDAAEGADDGGIPHAH